jgi:hypothetical protein
VFYDMNGGFYWDELTGWHIYKKGNVIVQNSYSLLNNMSARRMGLHNEGEPLNKVGGFVIDTNKNKSGNVSLSLDMAGMFLTWKLEVYEGVKASFPSGPTYQPEFTLPQNIIFIKQ